MRSIRGGEPKSTTPPPLIVSPTHVHLTNDEFQGRAGQEEDQTDEVTDELVAKGPQMFMEPAEEMQERGKALAQAVEDAARNGLPPECVEKLRELVMRTYDRAFRRALVGEPPANVEPMQVKLKPGAQAVRAKPRVYPPHKAAWLAKHMEHLVEAGMVYRNNQAVYGSVAMAIPKGNNNFRLVSDYRAVNATIEQAAFPMPHLESMPSLFAQAKAFCTLDLLQGYWQMPLRPEAQELFTMVTTSGLFTPTRVPQGVLNATAYFQSVMHEVLDGLIRKVCLVWVDDVVIWGTLAKSWCNGWLWC